MKALRNAVIAIFVFFLAVLIWLSLRTVGVMDYYTYDETITLGTRNLKVDIPLALGILALAAVVCKGLTAAGRKLRNDTRATVGFLVICSVFIAVFAYLWQQKNIFEPMADQAIIWYVASVTAGKLQGDVAPYAVYLIRCSNQWSVIVAMRYIIKVLGADPATSIRIVNIGADILTMWGLCGIAWQRSRNRRAVVLTALFYTLFAPPLIYTSLVYGTSLFICFTVLAFRALCMFYDKSRYGNESKSKFVWLALVLVFNAAAYMVYMGSLIGTAAIFCSLAAFTIGSRKYFRNALIVGVVSMALLVSSVFAVRAFSDYKFKALTGIEEKNVIPQSAWLLMGITAEGDDCSFGPGSHNYLPFHMYDANNGDTGATAREVRAGLRKAVHEYISGERDKTFFITKTRYQWCDPWWESLAMTMYPQNMWDEMTDEYRQWLDGPLIHAMYEISACLMLIVYITAFSGGLADLFAKRAKMEVEYHIPEIYFIGGFIFQFFWESKSRYCMPYFLIIIPLAAVFTVRILKPLLFD